MTAPVDHDAARGLGSMYGPVTSWESDFDHADPAYNERAPEIWAELRERCPVAHSDRYGGVWLPVTHEDVAAIAYDTEHYSSRGVVVTSRRPIVPAPVGPAPPITSDPPFHHEARRILLPAFSPKAIDPWEPEVRRLCQGLLDRMGDLEPGDVVDVAVEYAQHIPVNVIARMLGFPVEDDDLFRGFVHDLLENVNAEPEARIAALQPLGEYIEAQIEDHLARPRDDLTSFLLGASIMGQPLAPEHVRGSIVLLLIAGIDTTWSAIGSSLWHLAQHPEDRRRLSTDPSVVPSAVEELLRVYAPVTMARLVAQAHELRGCPLEVDDWVLLPFPAANRDPAVFPDPDRVVIDRQENRHAAFGLGIHRCLGSNLARLELRVAIEELLARIPEFELAGDVRWSVGQIRGPRQLPVRVLG